MIAIGRAIGRIAAAAKIDPSYSPCGANVHPLSNALFLETTVCVCLLITTMSPAKTDKTIDMPFGMWIRRVPKTPV